MYRIPFNKPALFGNELHYMAEAVSRGHISGDGYFTRRCQSFLEEHLGVAKALLTTSCTHALEMAALLLDLQPGDEVIAPSFTFVSTVNAFVLRGARPVFVDIRPDTLNLDEAKLDAAISPATKVIVPVHYAGVGCELDTVLAIAARHGVVVVEDNAQGLFAKYKDRFLGTFGTMAALSFHETKNFSCGEGGALIVNDPQYIERAEVIREKGTNRPLFFRGHVDRYTWVDLGSSYLPSDLLAAFLYGQFEARKEIQDARRRIWNRYHDALSLWAKTNGVGFPHVPESCEQPYHLFGLLMPTAERREALIDHLRVRGILSVFHYQPLHLSEMGRRFGGKTGDCPVAEDVSRRLLRLPFYGSLSESDQAEVIDAIHQFAS